MKSIQLCLSALLLSLTLTAQSPGQNASSQILTRGQVAALPSSATAATAASADSAGAETAGGRQQPFFPALSPTGNRSRGGEASPDHATDAKEFAGPAITVTFSLAVVLGLFAGLVWFTRKFGSRGLSHGGIPKQVLQGLGSTPIDARTRITLVRCGNRILVIAQTATGVHPLCEITDPDEVRGLSAACLGNSKQAFASALQSIEREKADAGYLGTQTDSATPRRRGRLFATA